jgi:hypothetical protein
MRPLLLGLVAGIALGHWADAIAEWAQVTVEDARAFKRAFDADWACLCAQRRER